MSKKTKGILKYTAKDCRKSIERMDSIFYFLSKEDAI